MSKFDILLHQAPEKPNLLKNLAEIIGINPRAKLCIEPSDYMNHVHSLRGVNRIGIDNNEVNGCTVILWCDPEAAPGDCYDCYGLLNDIKSRGVNHVDRFVAIGRTRGMIPIAMKVMELKSSGDELVIHVMNVGRWMGTREFIKNHVIID